MIAVNIDGHEIRVDDKKFDGAITLKLLRELRSDVSYTIDVLDRIVEGGSEHVFRILDPENGDPSMENEVIPFITKVFEEATVKNSSGSQNLPKPVSQQSEPTSSDTSVLISMTPTEVKPV